MNAKHLIHLGGAMLLIVGSLDVARSERPQPPGPGESSMAAAHVKCGQDGAVEADDRRGPLQRAIDTARPHTSILVSGTCQENVTIPLGKDGITLDGGGSAAITAIDPTQPAVLVRAQDITVRGFTIAGGLGGVAVTQGGRALIDGNVIRDSGFYGVVVSQLSAAVIVNNTIQNHQQAGIGVAETSYAFIGFVLASDSVASPNVITGNRAQGVVVFRGSYARIVGNEISQNGANGVNVRESSSAQISDNTVNGNGANGVFVAQGSGVVLGSDMGNTIFTRPNMTTSNNSGFGIRCQVGANVDGRLGTLNGNSGPESYVEGCIPSVIH